MNLLLNKITIATASLNEARQEVLKREAVLKELVAEFAKEMGIVGYNSQLSITEVEPVSKVTWKEKILDVLEKNADRVFSVSELSQMMQAPPNKVETIRTTIYILASKGKVIKTDAGKFKARKINL